MANEHDSPVSATKKRKLSVDEELEINLNLPEPPSKKAKRKEKKAKSSTSTVKPDVQSELHGRQELSTTKNEVEDKDASNDAAQAAPKRSEHGIWMGNLPFTVTKETLRDFFQEQGGIGETDVVRVHLPTTTVTGAPSGKKTQNKGFAYVDFTSKAAMELALSLSEKLLSGRKVLIKNAKSFEGRPEKADKAATDTISNDKGRAREPTKKIFVGNLGFDVTREDLLEHFSQAGEVEDIFMATFEDSGKCKGFAWLRFAELEAAEAAVKGFIFREPRDQGDVELNGGDHSDREAGDDHTIEASSKANGTKKKQKPQKWFINRLNGRQLRCEFAEDAQTRYKKRFSKDGRAPAEKGSAAIVEVSNNDAEAGAGIFEKADRYKVNPQRSRPMLPDKEHRREERRRRHEKMDARAVAPGKALANAPRASGAIVAGRGTKVVFGE